MGGKATGHARKPSATIRHSDEQTLGRRLTASMRKRESMRPGQRICLERRKRGAGELLTAGTMIEIRQLLGLLGEKVGGLS